MPSVRVPFSVRPCATDTAALVVAPAALPRDATRHSVNALVAHYEAEDRLHRERHDEEDPRAPQRAPEHGVAGHLDVVRPAEPLGGLQHVAHREPGGRQDRADLAGIGGERAQEAKSIGELLVAVAS